MMYYYKRKSNPFKWVIIVLIFMALGALVYWFYYNYFSRIELNNPKADNINALIDNSPRLISGALSLKQGEVQINIGQKGYSPALDQAVLHQGDKIKTGANSLAVLDLSDTSKIRLAANTEISLTNLQENNILLELISGRIYNNLALPGQYQIKSLNAVIGASGSKFEIQADAVLKNLAVLVFSNNVNLKINDPEAILLISSRLDANERGAVDFKAIKKDMFKITNFDLNALTNQVWYKWNFDLDTGLAQNPPDQEPAFEAISDSLVLTALLKDNSVNLSWSIYNQDNFKAYKVVRSDTKSDLKYPNDQVIKSSDAKNLAAYSDTTFSPGKKYYYRVCVVKTSDKVACGNMVSIDIPAKDTLAPAAPSLSATVSAAGMNLNWSLNNDADFKEYRVLRSYNSFNFSSPLSDYLAKKNLGIENYLDKEVNFTSPGNIYYRVCSLDTSDNFSCSNIITVENGVIK